MPQDILTTGKCWICDPPAQATVTWRRIFAMQGNERLDRPDLVVGYRCPNGCTPALGDVADHFLPPD